MDTLNTSTDQQQDLGRRSTPQVHDPYTRCVSRSKRGPSWEESIGDFTTIFTLQWQLTRLKDQDPMLSRAGVVYRIPCSCGDETRRAMRTCLKEHQAATRRGETGSNVQHWKRSPYLSRQRVRTSCGSREHSASLGLTGTHRCQLFGWFQGQNDYAQNTSHDMPFLINLRSITHMNT